MKTKANPTRSGIVAAFRLFSIIILVLFLPLAPGWAAPSFHLIPGVPFVLQKPDYCGPASMEMVLKYNGITDLDQDFLAKADPDNKGTHYQKLIDYVNRYGKSRRIKASALFGSLTLLKQYLVQNRPFIVRQWSDHRKKSRHYRVVIGYDDNARKIYFHDPQKGPDQSMSYDLFMELWDIHDKRPRWRTRNLMIVLEGR